MTVEIRSMTEADREAAWRVRVGTFGADPDAAYDPDEHYVAQERRLVADEDGRIVGHLARWDLGHWFGGRRVATSGIAGVGITADRRRTGIGRRLLVAALQAARAADEPLASLFPATLPPYRRLGWELAGQWPMRRIRLRDLHALPQPDDPPALRPGTPADLTAIAATYERWAAGHQGMLSRSTTFTARVLALEDGAVLWVAERQGECVGYVGYEHSETTAPHMGYDLAVTGLVALDHDTELTLWRLLASSSSVAGHCTVVAPPQDPLTLDLPALDVHPDPEAMPWMLRLVDAPSAVARRGWPAQARVTVELDIQDPILGHHTGPHVLTLDGGDGRLEPGGAGRVRVSIGDLSALYGGLFDAEALAGRGRLPGAGDGELAALTTAFSAPTPWLVDYF